MQGAGRRNASCEYPMEIVTARNSHGQITGIPYDWFSDCHREATHRPGRASVVRKFRSVFRKSPCRRAQRLFPEPISAKHARPPGHLSPTEQNPLRSSRIHFVVPFRWAVARADCPNRAAPVPSHTSRANALRQPQIFTVVPNDRSRVGGNTTSIPFHPGSDASDAGKCIVRITLARPCTDARLLDSRWGRAKTKSPRSFLNVPHLAASF